VRAGDLVKPVMTCSGQPGDRTCDIAVVVNYAEELNNAVSQAFKILCKCGLSEQYEWNLEVISESR